MTTSFPILSWLLGLPLAGTLTIAVMPKERVDLIRRVSMLFALAGFALALLVFWQFDPAVKGVQFAEKSAWIEAWGVNYYLGVDGISLLLVLLTSFLSPFSIFATRHMIADRCKGFLISLQVLQLGMLGALLALDLLFFYVFWEVMLIPMLFIIGIWGGQRRIYASIKFFLYTMAGSLLMLVALTAVFLIHEKQTGIATADIFELYKTAIPLKAQLWLFSIFALAFAIKVPMFPFHTWLPDAHVEAPTIGSVILAAVLLKMGVYGFMRFAYPLFPEAAAVLSPLIAVLAVIGIIYGALVAMVQDDVKKLIAFSSVSHLGYVMLGLAALDVTATAGSVLQMINHGISTGMLFFLVGMIYDRRHTRLIADFGGIAKVVPWYAVFFLIATLASIGLPGTNGFVGEFLILLGTFKSRSLPVLFEYHYAGVVLSILAACGVILGAVYMLWMVQRVFFGPLEKVENRALRDVNMREVSILLPFVAVIFLTGVFPQVFLSKVTPSIQSFVEDMRLKTHVAAGQKPGVKGL
jgi:NADH-quinone oxidoreductase subunit M